MKMRYVVRGIPFSLRLVLFGLLDASGIAVQMLFRLGSVPGIALVAAGSVLLLARSYSNKPDDLGEEAWKPVSMDEFHRVRSTLLKTRKNRLPLFYRPAAVGILIVPVIILLFITIRVSASGGASGGGISLFLAVIDTFLIAFPLLLSGQIRLWTPRELAMKVDTFYPIAAAGPYEGLVLTPYLRFDRDRSGQEIPEDIRLMAELRRNPEDFVGIQLQVAVNNGPNGAVPYLYAVYLCRGLDTYTKIRNTNFGSFITEAGGDEEYNTIVVRQETSGTGYHTTEADCRRLFQTVTRALNGLSSVQPEGTGLKG